MTPDRDFFIKKIVKLQGKIDNLHKIFKEIEDEKDRKIADQQKELQTIEGQLTTCQQEKDDLQKQLDNKITELANSNLSQEQKSQQIITLASESQKQFSKINQQLSRAWQSHQQMQQKVIENLNKPCSVCPEKERAKGYLEQKIVWLLGIIVIMLFFFLIFHVWFIRMAWRKKEKKEKAKSGCCQQKVSVRVN